MLTIRTAGVADIPELRKLVYQVWPQTYESILPAEKITYMLELMYSEGSLQRQMEEGAHFIFVDDNDEAVGYASYQEIEPGLSNYISCMYCHHNKERAPDALWLIILLSMQGNWVEIHCYCR